MADLILEELRQINAKLQRVNERLDVMHERLTVICELLDVINERLSCVSERLSCLSERLSCVNERLCNAENRLFYIVLFLTFFKQFAHFVCIHGAKEEESWAGEGSGANEFEKIKCAGSDQI